MLAKEDWKQSLVAIQNAIFGNVQENPFDAGGLLSCLTASYGMFRSNYFH